jgi:DNA-directed RNA polymerase specialized sigma24 family protein
METTRDASQAPPEFVALFERCEPSLRRALVAIYGPVVGRDAAADALSWAWEHWDRVSAMENPAGYLFRVGQTAARRHLVSRPLAFEAPATSQLPDVEPQLQAALDKLSEQQRAAVVLVHGYGIAQREVAELIGVSVSTLREHLARGMRRLNTDIGGLQ